MSETTGIEWTDATWNPATGCTKISPGCANCYIERTPPFRMHGRKFDAKGRIALELHHDRLDIPLHWQKPRMVFVNSLSDLFHEDIPDEFIGAVFATMLRAKQHIFQVLTKRPRRMLSWFRGWYSNQMPSKNVWLGVTVENQHFASERIPLLLQTPAHVRFISAEPLLEEIELPEEAYKCSAKEPHPVEKGWCPCLSWVITGAESGPGARACDSGWIRSLVEQCEEVGLPIFVKQLCERGIKIPFENWPEDLRVREFPT